MSKPSKPKPVVEEKIDEQDRELFLPALAELGASQEILQSLNQRLANAQRVALQKHGAVTYLFERMKTKYKLNKGDDIDSTGAIIRKR